MVARVWTALPYVLSIYSAFMVSTFQQPSMAAVLVVSALLIMWADLKKRILAVQSAAVEAVLMRVFADRELALTQAQAAALPGAIRRAAGKAHDE